MLCRVISLGFLVAGVSLASAQTSNGREVSSQVSPLGTFDLVYFQERNVLKTVTELRLEGRVSGFEDQVLFRGGEATWAFISPDEEWIAVNSADSPTSGLLHLFRRNANNEYVDANAEVERRALAALMKSAGWTSAPRFDVFFCYADFWSRTSGCLLGHIEARPRGADRNSRFYFVYDPETRRVSLDLKMLNRGAFQGVPIP